MGCGLLDTIARFLGIVVPILPAYELLNRYNCSKRADFHTFQAAGARIGMRQLGMFVPKKIHLADNL
ncbi:hypothetical protein EZS27_018644 [termite gut metagenome]|uniref:Uncharacterized protein n=1 Tax=termite gut metagenome TaxID=433724 RepID=A0A5J4RH29_9ZZZZ